MVNIQEIRVRQKFSMKSLTFSCLICAFNGGATKPIFCSKVAQKGKICSSVC